MTDEDESGAGAAHRVPVLDKALRVLARIAAAPEGIGIAALSSGLGISRATVYRILNTLADHGMVRRASAVTYVLGPGLRHLAAAVPDGPDLEALARPVMQALSDALGETTKLSVRDGDAALVLAVCQSRSGYGIAVTAGRRIPLHAGAAGRVLLGGLPPGERDVLLRLPLERFTAATLGDRQALEEALGQVAAQGWAEDRGEYVERIWGLSAPVRAPGGGTAAALSVVFIAGADAARLARIREALLTAAAALSRAVATGGSGPGPTARGR